MVNSSHVSINSQIVESAQYMNDCGFATFPLKPGCKTPKFKGWQKSDVVPEVTAADYKGCSAYGVLLTEEDIIIDIDPRRDTGSKLSEYKALKKELKIATFEKGTFVVKTGGGGVHIYLKIKDTETFNKIRNGLPKYKSVEFKSKGRYVVGMGSIHPETKRPYTAHCGDAQSILEAPLELLTAVKVSKTKYESKQDDKYYSDINTEKIYENYLLSQKPAVEGDQGDKLTFTVAAVGKEYGLPPERTYELMSKVFNGRCLPPWSEEELMKKVNNAYEYAESSVGSNNPMSQFKTEDDTDTTLDTWSESDDDGYKLDMDILKNGSVKLKKTLSNVVTCLCGSQFGLAGLLGFNTFHSTVEFLKKAPWHTEEDNTSNIWSDRDAILLKMYLAKVTHAEFNTNLIHEGALVAAAERTFHPVRAHLDTLRWKGKECLDTWLIKYAGAPDTPYVRAVSANILIAAVARAFDPGCKVDNVLILEGNQGVGKSTLCKIIGGDWFTDADFDPSARQADSVQAIQGHWIVEISEFNKFRSASIPALKDFVTRQVDRVRKAYGREVENYRRQCVFIGTVNIDGNGYLSDITGNRRYWPVRLGHKIDLEGLKKARDQILAEAVVRFKRGDSHHLTDPKVIAEAQREQSGRMQEDPWRDPIEKWLAMTDNKGCVKTIVTPAQVWEDCLYGAIERFGRPQKTRINNVLMSLEWVPKRARLEGAQRSIYERPVGWQARKPVVEEDPLL